MVDSLCVVISWRTTELWCKRLVTGRKCEDSKATGWPKKERCYFVLDAPDWNQGICLPTIRLFRVSNKVSFVNQVDLVEVDIQYIIASVHPIHIPSTGDYYANNTINLDICNFFWPKSLQAEGDMESTNDNARTAKYYSNCNATIIVDKDNRTKYSIKGWRRKIRRSRRRRRKGIRRSRTRIMTKRSRITYRLGIVSCVQSHESSHAASSDMDTSCHW